MKSLFMTGLVTLGLKQAYYYNEDYYLRGLDSMEELSGGRTPAVIATEINTIKYQTGKVMTVTIIEIGRRLKEAKALLDHGEWISWLEESVSYSRKTAHNYIRLYEEYGNQEDVHSNVKSISHLNSTQALILLGIPEEERSRFIAEVDVESMSARELQKAVNERKAAEEERSLAEKERSLAKADNENLQKTVEDKEQRLIRLTAERDQLMSKGGDQAKAQIELERKVRELSKELDEAKEGGLFKKYQRLSKDLNTANTRVRANRIDFLYNEMDKNFRELLWEMGNFAKMEPEIHASYRRKVIDFLSNGLQEKI